MALAPRSALPLRSLVWLRIMSHSKPYLISFSSSSSSDDAILLAARGTATPVARAVQPPTAPGSSCGGSVTPEQKVLHPLPSSTPKFPIHKPSRPALQYPDQPCNILQPLKDKPLPAKHGDHKVPQSPKFSHFPNQSIAEPVGKSLTPLEDPRHSVPGDSCITLQPVTHKYSPKARPNHKVREDPDIRDRRIPKDRSLHEPPHPTPAPFINEHAYKSPPKPYPDHKVCENLDIRVRQIPKDGSFREPPHPSPDPFVNEHAYKSSPKPHHDHKVCEDPPIRVSSIRPPPHPTPDP
ncbi:hypothetical protein CFC21_098736 [Triticum aestivum]|uniref:Uncharacterized protein n=2 Tax=Triticum aestivum TaxID=4565 RepID=A0A3B6RMD8_WHEAT|nr:extensin-like [Triticum aestivum]KAF7096844.1 hypothetical protein CFC21_098736 [Triticum aestivum]